MLYRILLLVTMISQVAYGQTVPKDQTKPFVFVDSILNKDDMTAEILDFAFSPEIQDILLRFQKAMADNKEWIEEYFSKNYKAGEGLPYHEKFGITIEEYQKVTDMNQSPPSVVVKGSVQIKVKHTAGNISFTTTDEELKFIELLEIDLKKQIVVFNNDTVPYSNEINAPASTPFGEWDGYSWKKESSNLGEKDDLKIDKLISKIVEINFGKVKSTGKILLRIKYKDVDRGQINANIDMACYLK
ncbi:hypothetical protein [Lacibacter sp.]|uniref:hypothetical protein n=1 Tax=Lacibacter sp. TaxID=1915409 RepID=UPI002B4B0A08|nr:hypothetical protein [Lacibacter sp.]HLP36579.1 hypothetical protein [Lacibacter sp.]